MRFKISNIRENVTISVADFKNTPLNKLPINRVKELFSSKNLTISETVSQFD